MKANATTEITTKVVNTKVTLTLEMTEAEAALLLAVVGKISGSLDGPRHVTDYIYEALHNAGVRPTKGVFWRQYHGGPRVDRPAIDQE